jgi:hypothetical protein
MGTTNDPAYGAMSKLLEHFTSPHGALWVLDNMSELSELDEELHTTVRDLTSGWDDALHEQVRYLLGAEIAGEDALVMPLPEAPQPERPWWQDLVPAG